MATDLHKAVLRTDGAPCRGRTYISRSCVKQKFIIRQVIHESYTSNDFIFKL